MKKIYLFLTILTAMLASSSRISAQLYHITGAAESVDTSCNGHVGAHVMTNTYTVGQAIEISWGNATVDTVNVTNMAGQGNAQGSTIYTSVGAYTIKYVLINAGQRVDSQTHNFNYNGCQHISISSYNDINNNCVFDAGDIPNYFPLTIEIDSSNVVIDTVDACGLYFIHYGPPGTIYTYKIIATPPGITVTCPLSGIIYDTVNAPNQHAHKYFALNCAPVPAYDLAEHVSIGIKPTWAYINIHVTNTDCNGANATLVANLSPKIAFSGAYPAPTTVVGNTVTWNFGVAAYIPQYVTLAVDTPFIPSLTVGDTLQYSFYLTPTAGDTNVSNNTVIRVDTVKAAWDPNYKNVSPQGDITAGTRLEYTIHFQNTGNDTARNIHILDTLSDNVTPNTFNLVSTTADVYTELIKYGGSHYILKFDFPNINLPDSSHHGHDAGMVVYNIQSKPTLPPGTYIPNRAGIYFDVNPVVMTNQVVNKIHVPEKVEILNSTKIAVFPNPVNDLLTITTDMSTYSTIEITNTLGQIVLKQSIKQNNTKINVKTLPAGIYFANLKGEMGNKTIKFEKL
ncbi:MAG: T9SS type A sorting domain-containing protein [Bacteroidetes bacterium]|nr:T9SS type A sorting domain-containing protein [Bacteroidota bacterium]